MSETSRPEPDPAGQGAGEPDTGIGWAAAAEPESPAEVGTVEPDPEDPQWWQDPSLPWQHKPSRSDVVCFTWLGIAGVYGIVISILRPGLLASAPKVLASQGSWSGVVMTGALAQGGDPWWPLVWALATIGFLKFDWIYWWAGRLWGPSLIEVWSGKSERARRWNERAARFARKYETLALIVNFLPIPLPRAVILAVLGEAGTSLRKLLTVSVISSFVTTGAYLWVGWYFGPPARFVMETYGNYLWYVSIVLLVWVIWTSWRTAAKNKADAAG